MSGCPRPHHIDVEREDSEYVIGVRNWRAATVNQPNWCTLIGRLQQEKMMKKCRKMLNEYLVNRKLN